MHHCLFKENTATYSGGAISMSETRGSIVNCSFERNSVESRLQRGDFGGAVCALSNSQLTVHHCLFKKNTATYTGGATYIQKSHIDIKQCLFKENTANHSGGSISMQETRGSFVNCTIERNSVENRSQGHGFGGAVHATNNSHLTVHHCLFKENTATYNGGAISMSETRGSIVNCSFERNSVESRLQRGDFGGAVCASSNSHLTVHHCLFKKNIATYTGGATYIQKSHIDIKQCLFKENTANHSGGAISMQETRGSFVNCTFERNAVENRLQGHGYGGAVHATNNSHLTVHHCLFKENTATYSGGAISMQETRGSFVNCTFERNAVENRLQGHGYGGAVHATNNSHLTVHHCLFKENTATYSGGAISMSETRGSIVNCSFERNSVESRLQRGDFGGAVCALSNSHLNVHHCLFKENTATYSGGAISMQETRGSFVNCTFERNSVENRSQGHGFGGAVHATNNSHLTVHHCLFKENTATYSGGAISMSETRGSIVNCSFERNSVESRLQRGDFGGAVCASSNSHLTVHHCLFKENTANWSGGATYIQKSHIDIKQCLFKENTANHSGGAISMQETRGSFVSCTFEKNSVENRLQFHGQGGAVRATNNSHLTVHHCFFKENTATYNGGAISMSENRGSFVNCAFVGNAVRKLQENTFGGAISSVIGSFFHMMQCFFKKNTATFSGGACYIQNSQGSFENCTFEGKV